MIRVLIMLALLIPAGALAKEAAINAEDPVVELRLMELAEELRCLVCQNQTLADSDAELAKDFRREIRVMIKEGLSDQEIIEFLVTRYGDFVRYRPPFKGTTYVLWFGPLLLIAIGGMVLVTSLKRRKREVDAIPELTKEEQKRAEVLLAGKKGKSK